MNEQIRTEVRGAVAQVTVHACNCCNAWCHVGEAIRHSKRCDTPLAQPEIKDEALTTPSARRVAADSRRRSAAEIKRLAREGSGLSADEVFEAHQRGQLTTSEAMNRDD